MMKRFCVGIVMISLPAVVSAKALGTFGATYPFTEKDALTEIEERARKVDWAKIYSRGALQVERYRPSFSRLLPRAGKHNIRPVDMTYTLDEDIPDPRYRGRSLYPRGFTFNPLGYVKLPGAIVFLDADDKVQLKWFNNSSFVQDGTTIVLLTGGDISSIERLIHRPAFYATDQLVDRFDIRSLPSVARQKQGIIEVEEIHVKDNRSNR